MQTPISSPILLEAHASVTQKDLSALAHFCDERAHGVSFYFSLSSSPDNSHREEVLMIKELVRGTARQRKPEDGIGKDLDAIVKVAEEVRQAPSRLRAIFACHDERVWHAFDLPACGSVSRLDVGRHFHLRPLLQALQSDARYCVVIVEHGKARGFVVQGTEIQEVHGRFETEHRALHADDSRVGWSHHIDDNLQERAKHYLKELALEVARFTEAQGRPGLIIGCREDLWSALEPHLSRTASGSVLGRFLPPNFDVSPAEVLAAVKPIFEKTLGKRYPDWLHEINESVSHGVIGLDQVLESLEEGRVQKLLVGKPSNTTISECGQCGHLHSPAASQCVFCGSSNTHAVLAEEALIRKALLTEAEILLPGPGARDKDECDGVAAWLRY
jgi:Bacterial archaeo-eukaryotic release factor family 10